MVSTFFPWTAQIDNIEFDSHCHNIYWLQDFNWYTCLNIDLLPTTLIEVELAVFRLMKGCTVNVIGTTNLTHVQVGNIDGLDTISVITDSPMVCCSIGSKMDCSGPKTKLDWRGAGLKPDNRSIGGVLSFSCFYRLHYSIYTESRGRVVTRWPGSQKVGGSNPAATKIVRCKNLAFNIGECVYRG